MSPDIVESRIVLVPVTRAYATHTSFSLPLLDTFHVYAEGEKPLNIRNPHLTPQMWYPPGGLAVVGVVGRPRLGPITSYRTPVYSYQGQYQDTIYVQGANGIVTVKVRLLKDEEAESFLDTLDAAA
ncbi:hypothetical protein [Burkholderia pseudomallei]|uniref:hypothetical protein n=1 Tax=Burkholderia pseudomallei TaxID=28450 RepID=UPI0004311438|nr:hypothetical protein [Burkholderia pseudomallei]EXI99350.1 hypothetical protein T210_0130375 [Burkholderia pseudomallei MSHR6137]OMT57141.1 hypothetical protein AQ760_07585 [Burkholderia pseudomallei]OMW38119.1 hypothetical protein AQ809_08895 [Burkholderia pseudomallei]OMZ32090.1 hypothetical protein AQ860_19205 [Burkholderia pseudomallei]OMZ32596.1 hypothetical protein AQ859_16415 [Burkholderia pseudomallei]